MIGAREIANYIRDVRKNLEKIESGYDINYTEFNTRENVHERIEPKLVQLLKDQNTDEIKKLT